MAKKAELKNLSSLQGVNIFKNGLLPTPQAEVKSITSPAPVTVQPVPASVSRQPMPAAAPVQSPAVTAPVPAVSTTTAPPPATNASSTVPAVQTPTAGQSVTDDHVPPQAQKAKIQEEKKMLRSYHLPESLIQRLEDAQMVYQIRKEKTNKQDIVVEALTRYLDELEQQGFFNVLKALRA